MTVVAARSCFISTGISSIPKEAILCWRRVEIGFRTCHRPGFSLLNIVHGFGRCNPIFSVYVVNRSLHSKGIMLRKQVQVFATDFDFRLTPRVRHILETRWKSAGKPVDGWI